MSQQEARPIRVEPGHKRIRALFAGEYVADSTRVRLVWEKPFYPTYFFPSRDVRTDLLVAANQDKHSTRKGIAGAASRGLRGTVRTIFTNSFNHFVDTEQDVPEAPPL